MRSRCESWSSASDSDCYRLVNGEGDGLAGVVIDRYSELLVVQLLTAGADRMRDELVGQLTELLHPDAILERSSGAVRKNEGLKDRAGLLAGEEISEVEVRENGNLIVVDFEHGQKTGYFLDQRENRARLGKLCRGAKVLDAYCYAGGFALAALSGGAEHAIGIDTSARAIQWAQRNLELNGQGRAVRNSFASMPPNICVARRSASTLSRSTRRRWRAAARTPTGPVIYMSS